MSKFRKGDRVRCICTIDGNYRVKGELGHIIDNPYNDCSFLVKFDNNINGHNGEGGNNNGYCWYCRPGEVELVSRKEHKVIIKYGIVSFMEKLYV